MNELSIDETRTRLAIGTVSVLVTIAVMLTVPAVMAQSSAKQKNTPPAEWPEKAPYTVAIEAFDAALTRAGWDEQFRKRLIESPDSAKNAVAETRIIRNRSSKVIMDYGQTPAEVRA